MKSSVSNSWDWWRSKAWRSGRCINQLLRYGITDIPCRWRSGDPARTRSHQVRPLRSLLPLSTALLFLEVVVDLASKSLLSLYSSPGRHCRALRLVLWPWQVPVVVASAAGELRQLLQITQWQHSGAECWSWALSCTYQLSGAGPSCVAPGPGAGPGSMSISWAKHPDAYSPPCLEALAELIIPDLWPELDLVETGWYNQTLTKKKTAVQCYLPPPTTLARASVSNLSRCFHFFSGQSRHTEHGFL